MSLSFLHNSGLPIKYPSVDENAQAEDPFNGMSPLHWVVTGTLERSDGVKDHFQNKCLFSKYRCSFAFSINFSDTDKKLYDQTFKKCDEDKDGYVNGTEIKGVFLQVITTQFCSAMISHF